MICRQEERKRPTIVRLIGLFALVLFLGFILSKLGLVQTGFSVNEATSIGAVFLLGLVAATSSCMAVSGGLLLSSVAAFNERYKSATALERFRPVLLFVVGRLSGYALFGGLLALLGKILTPSPTVTAIVAILAACYMLVTGLDLLQIAPRWLRHLMPRMPRAISRRVVDAQGKPHPIAPFLLGAGTFFLPCGFTQALQLYALTTGSFWTGALTLFAFALGTAPALMAVGYASNALKGRVGRFFFQLSGALLVVLGFWNIQNGLTIAGHPLSLSFLKGRAVAAGGMSSKDGVVFDGKTQVMNMAVYPTGYVPNRFAIRAGVPTKWEINGTNAVGCISVLQSRTLGIQKLLERGNNEIVFTAPSQPGVYSFSCAMGMYRGQITVVPNAS